ncbi:MAG: YncE family protein [Alphaproteobacteria bacterium]|nr:YncE family protein [Alphaproteobacteria bacterium]
MKRLKTAASWRVSLLLATLSICGVAAESRAQGIYVASQDSSVLSVVNGAALALTATIPTGSAPLGVAVTTDGSTVLVANSGSNTVSIIDAASGVVSATVAVGKQPSGIAVAPNGATAYVANTLDNTVSVISVATAKVVATVPVGLSPFGVAVTPNGAAVYVANSFDNTVSAISGANNTVSATVPVGASPSGVAASPDGSTVYVTNTLDNTVSAIAVSSNSVTSTIAVGAHPFGIASSADSTRVYVANMQDGNLSVAPVAGGSPSTVTLGGAPYGVSLSPDGTQIYVVNPGVRTLAIISASSTTVTASVSVPGKPASLGVFAGAKTPASSALVAAILPLSRSVGVGNTSSVFATVLNSKSTALTGCQVSFASAPTGLTVAYQTTNASNQPTGSANQPFGLAANGSQSLVLTFNDANALQTSSQPLLFQCTGTSPAAIVAGLDLPVLTFSTTPTPDIIPISATATNDGILTVPVNGAGAFAVAAIDIGAAGSLTALVDTQGVPLPLTLTICQSNASNNGACSSTLNSTAPATFATNGTLTYSVFVTPTGAIPFSPGTSRIFVRFVDANNVAYGATSVAVRTN